jgi:hypothetical protein
LAIRSHGRLREEIGSPSTQDAANRRREATG